MADAAKPVGRPMKYPYTFSAKIAQFPYKFYYQNSWLARYWLFGIAAAFPLFYKIHGMGKLFYNFRNENKKFFFILIK